MQRLKFAEFQRAVVQRAGQTKAVLDQDRLARAVAGVHPAELRDGGVRFVHDQQIIARKEIQQCAGARSGRAAREVSRIIFDAGAKTHFLHHFQIVFRAHLDALGLEQFPARLEPRDALAQFLANGQQGVV